MKTTGFVSHEEENMRHKYLCYAAIGVVLFIAFMLLPFLIDKASAEPQRLTTDAQRAKIAAKGQVKSDNMPDLQKMLGDIDKAFPDNNQAKILKSIVTMLNAQED